MKRKASMVYAARVGDEERIFKTWPECQKFTHGRNASFKKFSSEKDAKAWLQGETYKPPPPTDNFLHIYTDGSLVFDGEKQRMGIGACYDHEGKRYELWSCLNEKEIQMLSPTTKMKDLKLSSSLAELYAIGFALRNTFPDSYDGLVLHVDNNCAPGWVTGKFEIHKPYIVPIVTEIRKLMKPHKKVTLEHVKGHSSDPMNDAADRLASIGSHDDEDGDFSLKFVCKE